MDAMPSVRAIRWPGCIVFGYHAGEEPVPRRQRQDTGGRRWATVRCRDCGGSIEGCPSCGGWLETRMGRFGRLLGCSNFPDCEYTRNLRQPGAKSKRPSGTPRAGQRERR